MDLTVDVIRERIKANPQIVTVILDGFSEFSRNGYKGDILDLLYGKALMDLTVMVTSRPRAAAQSEEASVLRVHTHRDEMLSGRMILGGHTRVG